MDVTQSLRGDIMLVSVSGRLDSYWSELLSETLSDVVRRGRHRIRLDCSRVTFLSSAGIGVLMRFHRELEGIGGVLRVAEPSPAVTSVLRLTRLAEVLVERSPAVDVVEERRPDRSYDRHGLRVDVFELDAESRLVGDRIGKPDSPDRTTVSVRRSSNAELQSPVVAVGVGAFGDSYDDCRERFGELLSVAGTTVYQPADGTNVADYLVGDGALGAEVRVLHGLSCVGSFSHLVRFESARPDGAVGISSIIEVCLADLEADSMGVVIVGESQGLVGAALRRSPVGRNADADLFAFPAIRSRLAFTTERAFPRSVALVGGLVGRVASPSTADLMRPMGGGLVGHLHAAAFRFQPLRKGFVELGPTVRSLFDDDRLLGVLHLLRDDRGASGAGETELVRGACWLGRIA